MVFKYRKKWVISFLLFLVFLFSFSGCSPKTLINKFTSTTEVIAAPTQTQKTTTPLIIDNDLPIQITPHEPQTDQSPSIFTPTVNSTNRIDIPQGTIILTSDLGHELKMINIKTGTTTNLFPNRTFATFLGWRESGCNLLVLSEGNLDLISLEGERKKRLFSFSDLEKFVLNLDGSKPYLNHISLSPDGNWVSYWEVHGKPYDEMGPESVYEIQNIKIIPTEMKRDPIPLTKNGGGWIASWAPDGNRIAFSDFDEKGIVQVFIYSISLGEKKMVTNFDQVGAFLPVMKNIYHLEWSEDGRKLAISYLIKEDLIYHTATVIVDSFNGEELFQLSESEFLWWIDESFFLLRETLNPDEFIIYAQGIGKSSHSLPLMSKEFPSLLHLHPFTSTHLAGFFASFDDWYYFVFNSRDGSITPIPSVKMPEEIITDLYSTPADFPGIGNCNQ